MIDEIPDDMTEIYDADVPRVDLVGAAANGIPRFLIAKGEGNSGLLGADYVRELIAKADPEPATDPRETVTMSGSPAAIAALIHGAAVRKAAPAVAEPDGVAKAEVSNLLRAAIGKAVLARCEDLFPGYLAPIEEPVMVRAEHDDVLKSVCAAVFPGHDMADIAGRLVPAAQRALVEKLGADCFAPGAHSAVGLHNSTLDLPGMPGALATLRAVGSLGPDRSVVSELASADLTGLRKATGSIGDTRRTLVLEAARAAAEFGSRVSLGAAGNDGPGAKQARFRHGLSLHEEIQKAEASTASMNDRPDSDFAFIESGGKKDEHGRTVPRSLRHFPIYDAAHVRNALSRAPQSPFGDKALPKIHSAAKKFGIDVAKQADGPETSEVTKDMDEMPMDDAGGMDPCVVLAEPEDEAPGDPGDPGSPAWEGIDAATARKWTAIAARLRSALGVMADRESLEAATVDPDDAEAAMDLDDAACAVDFVIDTLAGFAVDEQAEADDAVMAMVGKSIGALDVAHLDTVESLGSVRKAGRTLSASNESALRAAIQALQQILASLPKAPDAATPSGQPVAKTANEEPNMAEPTLTEDVTAASGQQPAMGSAEAPPKPVAGLPVTDVAKEAASTEAPAPVVKAEKTPQVAIYDANGNLVGTVDPAEITMLAPAKAPEAAAAKSDDAMPEEPAAPAADAPATLPTDLTPAPAASVGTPADAVPADDDTVAKATDTSTTEDPQNVLKGSITELVKAAIQEQGARQGELLKSLEGRNQALEEQNAALVKNAAALEERLTKVENQPAVMAIASNGVTPPPHLMRGQDHGARVDVTKGEQLRAAFKASDDARQQKVLGEEMNLMAIDKLHEIHAAGPR